MSQVSRKKLDEKVYARIFEILISSLISINNKNKAEKFITDLLTNTEKIMLSKRLSIAFLLMKDYSYERIKHLLKVTSPTIWQVKRWMNERGSGYKIILQEIIDNESMKKMLYGFFDFLEDLLPPSRGTNWTEVRRKQWIVRRKREKAF